MVLAMVVEVGVGVDGDGDEMDEMGDLTDTWEEIDSVAIIKFFISLDPDRDEPKNAGKVPDDSENLGIGNAQVVVVTVDISYSSGREPHPWPWPWPSSHYRYSTVLHS